MKKTMQKLDIDEFEVIIGGLIFTASLSMLVEMYVRMFA